MGREGRQQEHGWPGCSQTVVTPWLWDLEHVEWEEQAMASCARTHTHTHTHLCAGCGGGLLVGMICSLGLHCTMSRIGTPHSSPFTHHSSLLTPHSSLLTPPLSSLITPHPSLLTHPSTSHPSLITSPPSLLTLRHWHIVLHTCCDYAMLRCSREASIMLL